MTADTIRRHAFAESRLLQRIGAYLETLAEERARNRIIRETRIELSKLSDRELADLGIHRAAIPRIAREATLAQEANRA
ncbi:MAG: DUF1127 domain-containing protein [Pseudomonadota bacterium]